MTTWQFSSAIVYTPVPYIKERYLTTIQGPLFLQRSPPPPVLCTSIGRPARMVEETAGVPAGRPRGHFLVYFACLEGTRVEPV